MYHPAPAIGFIKSSSDRQTSNCIQVLVVTSKTPESDLLILGNSVLFPTFDSATGKVLKIVHVFYVLIVLGLFLAQTLTPAITHTGPMSDFNSAFQPIFF